MGVTDTDWEAFPSYYELLLGTREFLEKTYRETFVEPPQTFSADFSWRNYTNFTLNDVLIVVTFATIWTILRHLTAEKIFKPLGYHYRLTPTNQRKMPESAWKFVFLLCSWNYTLYVVVLSGRYKFFQKPSTVWSNWNLEGSMPMDIYFLYTANCGYYLHSLYATLFLDARRKDYIAMVSHHTATLFLTFMSFSLRCHNVGCLVLFTHDASDALMEFSKLNVYFRTQDGNYVKKHGIIANVSFFLFIIAWVVGRLTWFPLRVLHTTTNVVLRMQLVIPGLLFMNSLAWTLQILNIYWFLLILQLLYRVVTGQEVDDSREYDVQEKSGLESKPHGNDMQNENAKTNGICDDYPVSKGDLAATVKKRS